jgi:hypothetical protein
MVRAVKLESTPSGSYYNASQGIFWTVGDDFSRPRASVAVFLSAAPAADAADSRTAEFRGHNAARGRTSL